MTLEKAINKHYHTLSQSGDKLDTMDFISFKYLDLEVADDVETEKHYDKEVSEVENKILEFISGLDSQHLKSIIYMSLDIEVEVGYPDKVMN